MLALAGSSVPGYVLAARSAAPVLALRRSRQPPATCFFNFGKADDDDEEEDTSQAQVKRLKAEKLQLQVRRAFPLSLSWIEPLRRASSLLLLSSPIAVASRETSLSLFPSYF